MAVARRTKSVKILLDAFDHSKSALSVAHLVKRFQSEMNKTTVYRALERLENEGILHSFTGNSGLKWFALCKEAAFSSHPHFQCQICGQSKCLPLNVAIPFIPNHRVDSVNLILIGQCEDCLSQ